MSHFREAVSSLTGCPVAAPAVLEVLRLYPPGERRRGHRPRIVRDARGVLCLGYGTTPAGHVLRPGESVVDLFLDDREVNDQSRGTPLGEFVLVDARPKPQ